MRAALTARTTRRLGAAAASGSMIAAMLLGSSPVSSAPLGDPTPDLAAASAYLVGNLVDGTHYEPFGPGSPDYGLTIDAALALAATGGDDAALGAITGWVAANAGEYTLIGTPLQQYVSGGEVAKVALLAQVTGNDPRSFGGIDLLAELSALECAGPDPTADSPCAAAGNYAGATSTFKQALGVLAQTRAAADATAPLGFLLSLQLATGAWPSALDPAGSPDIDSTAMAAMALALDPSAPSRAAIADALAWIAEQQQASGGFPGASGTSTNTAGLAIQALRLDTATYADQIATAEAALSAQQNVDGGFDISLENAAYGSDVRATAQAAGGAAGIPFGSLLRSVPALAAADDGAAYLVAQLVEGTHYTFDGSTFADHGLTADAVFALASHGGYGTTVSAITDWLAANAADYADPTGALFGGPYSGSLAKLALVAEATGRDPRAFGGYDMLALLQENVCAAADPAAGCNAAGEFFQIYSSISQSLGVLALQASTVPADHLTIDSPIVARLAQLQCADGGFASAVEAAPTCVSDVDATGFAVQALATVPGTDGWLDDAQQYLQSQQTASGLYSNGEAILNADSTAQAAIALHTLTERRNAPEAALGDSALAPPVAAWDAAVAALGALAVDGSGFTYSTADAAANTRSTTQAVLASSFGTLVALSRTPRLPVVDPPTTTEPTTTAPTATGPSATEAPTTALPTTTSPLTPDLAATGPEHAASLSLWGAALVAAGAGALLLARPMATRSRRH